MNAAVTAGDALKEAAARLAGAGLAEPEREAAYLLSARLGCSPTVLHVNRDQALSAAVAESFSADIDRRARREPAAYILGEASFYGRSFQVGPATLVPRPETELLVERVLKDGGNGPLRALDIGTGSGCIALTLAAERPAWTVTAVDKSPEALAAARINAERLGVSARIRFIISDLYANLDPAKTGDFDIIVSNPPYVATPVLPTLAPELEFEPRTALDGGQDGLYVIKPLIRGARARLVSGGRIFIEIGHDQGDRVTGLLQDEGFTNVTLEKDYAGHDRIATGVHIGSI